MIGIDTSFLVAFENLDHPLHRAARSTAAAHSSDGFALAPQVIAEFIHVVSDARRFPDPLTVDAAAARARAWWNGREVVRVFPTAESVTLCLDWVSQFKLGRKRLLDTMLAATYASSGVPLIATSNWRDFGIFPGIHPVVLAGPSAGRKYSRDEMNER